MKKIINFGLLALFFMVQPLFAGDEYYPELYGRRYGHQRMRRRGGGRTCPVRRCQQCPRRRRFDQQQRPAYQEPVRQQPVVQPAPLPVSQPKPAVKPVATKQRSIVRLPNNRTANMRATFVYNDADKATKDMIWNTLASSNRFPALRQALQAKLALAGYGPSRKPGDLLERQFLIEAAALSLLRTGSVDLEEILATIQRLNPLSPTKRAAFEKEVRDRFGQWRLNILTAQGIIEGNAGLLQTD